MKKIFMTWVLLAVVGSGMAQIASQGTDNIPMEGSMFYMENGKTTRGDSEVKWSFNSVVENCFDNTKKGQEAWLMTADGETQLKVTFEYNTDDERYKIESSDVQFCFYEGNDLFHDNKELINDPEIIGTYTKTETEKSVTLYMTAPQAFQDPTIS